MKQNQANETDSGSSQMNISLTKLMKQPGAFFPLAMSLAALAMVLVHTAMFGVVHDADEGTAAHIFQVLMVAQVPVVAFFTVKWLPRTPRRTLQVLTLQAGASLAAIAAVFFLT